MKILPNTFQIFNELPLEYITNTLTIIDPFLRLQPFLYIFVSLNLYCLIGTVQGI